MNVFFNGLGRFTVRFRWFIVVVWIIGTASAVHFLPSLASQVNNNNSAFLPASAPSTIAGNLAEPLVGKATWCRSSSSVSARTARSTPPTPKRSPASPSTPRRSPRSRRAVRRNLRERACGTAARRGERRRVQPRTLRGRGQRADGSVHEGRSALRYKFHLAGVVATNVAEQKASNSTGNKTQLLSILFIIVLLLFVFRSVLAPLVTLLPAAVVLQLSGSLIGELGSHGLKISQITQLLLIVLILGAGTDYGLFLVFRVREGLRSGLAGNDAVARAVARVGESISASAGTVILALLTLLFASFGIYHDLGVPLAIGIAVMLVAGSRCLPALLAILGRAVFWPAKIVPGEANESWWGKVAQRVIARPAHTLAVGCRRLRCARLRGAALLACWIRRSHRRPERERRRSRQRRIDEVLPAGELEPDQSHLEAGRPRMAGPRCGRESREGASGDWSLQSACRDRLTPPERRSRRPLYVRLHAALGNPLLLPALPRPGSPAAKVPILTYDLYRATARFVSPDGHTIQFEAGLTAGDAASTPALNAVPAIRAALTRVQHSIGSDSERCGRRGPCSLRRELDLRRRPDPHRPDRDHRHRASARAGAA